MQELEKYTIAELLLHIMQRLYDSDKVRNRARFGMLNMYIRQFERAHIQAASAIIMPARFGKYVKPAVTQAPHNDGVDGLYNSDITPPDVYETGRVNDSLDAHEIGRIIDSLDSEIPPIESMEDETAPVPTKRGRKKKCCS